MFTPRDKEWIEDTVSNVFDTLHDNCEDPSDHAVWAEIYKGIAKEAERLATDSMRRVR